MGNGVKRRKGERKDAALKGRRYERQDKTKERWRPKGTPLRKPRNVAPGFSPAFSWALSREATRCALRGSGSSNPVSGNRRADSPVERSKGLFERDSTRCTRRLRPWPPVCARCDRNSL